MEQLIKDHAAIVIVLISCLSTALLGCLLYIFKSLRDEIKSGKETFEREVKELKVFFSGLTDEIFGRLKETEASLNRLWGEHRAHLIDNSCPAVAGAKKIKKIKRKTG